jgi:hypothetical protein
MYTTVNNEGILNNYATEPDTYHAAYPSKEQQRNYALQSAIATILVIATVLVGLAVS